MQSSQPIDGNTPRTDEAIREELFSEVPGVLLVDSNFARQLERELIAATSELERTKEQLRVAREALALIARDSTDRVAAQMDKTLFIAFTQPKSSADSPEGADPVRDQTFPA